MEVGGGSDDDGVGEEGGEEMGVYFEQAQPCQERAHDQEQVLLTAQKRTKEH